MVKYTVETYEGERAIVGRIHGMIAETYPCGNLSRKEAIDMAKELAAGQERLELELDG